MSKQKSFLVIVISFFMLLLFIFVILLIFHVKKTDSIVLKEDLTCQYREKIKISQFVASVDGEILNDSYVDTSSIGKKRIDIRYKNSYGFVEKKVFSVDVVDVVAPIIDVNNSYEVVVGEVSNLLDILFCADDYDDKILCSVSGEYDLNLVGNYPLHISASDSSGNKTEKDFVLVVRDKSSNKKIESSLVDFKEFYQKYKDDSHEIGLDLSYLQGEVDFSKIASQGVSFVMLKVGEQSSKGGDIIFDPMFEKYAKAASDFGLKVGVYFSSSASNDNEARKQARWVIQKLREYHVELPIAFVWENWDYFSSFKIGFRSLNDIATSFLKEIERNGYDSMLYSNKKYLDNVWYKEDYQRWIAYYGNDLDKNYHFRMWQYCQNGKIDGVTGSVSFDVLMN